MTPLPKVVQLTLTRAEAIAVNNAIALAGATLDEQKDSMIIAVFTLEQSHAVEQLADVAVRLDAALSSTFPELVRL